MLLQGGVLTHSLVDVHAEHGRTQRSDAAALTAWLAVAAACASMPAIGPVECEVWSGDVVVKPWCPLLAGPPVLATNNVYTRRTYNHSI